MLKSKCDVLLVTRGYVKRGVGRGGYYVEKHPYKSLFISMLNCKPYPGTLNVELDNEHHVNALRNALEYFGPCLVYTPPYRELGSLYVLEAVVYGVIPALIVIPEKGVHAYPRILEIVACKRLRDVAERVGGLVYLAIGCGIIRCLNSWSTSMLRLMSLGL